MTGRWVGPDGAAVVTGAEVPEPPSSGPPGSKSALDGGIELGSGPRQRPGAAVFGPATERRLDQRGSVVLRSQPPNTQPTWGRSIGGCVPAPPVGGRMRPLGPLPLNEALGGSTRFGTGISREPGRRCGFGVNGRDFVLSPPHTIPSAGRSRVVSPPPGKWSNATLESSASERSPRRFDPVRNGPLQGAGDKTVLTSGAEISSGWVRLGLGGLDLPAPTAGGWPRVGLGPPAPIGLGGRPSSSRRW